VTTPHDQLYRVGEAIRNAGISIELQKLTFIPENLVPVQDSYLADQVLRLCDELEENDDVQNVHGNFDIAEELLTKLAH
jgi:transcriptional/translational regulatory protein YebC/TACO1